MEKNFAIRSFGPDFVYTSELSQGKKEMTFVCRCKEITEDGDDRAVYMSKTEKTVINASILKKPLGLDKTENPQFPEKIAFTVDEKHRLVF
jgi:hypothetical protein